MLHGEMADTKQPTHQNHTPPRYSHLFFFSVSLKLHDFYSISRIDLEDISLVGTATLLL